MAAKSKKTNFDMNPALAFITTRQQDEEDTTSRTTIAPQTSQSTPEPINIPAKTPKRSKGESNIIDPNGEKRTRRVQLLVRPSLYDKASAELQLTGGTFNSLIDDLLSEHVGEKR